MEGNSFPSGKAFYNLCLGQYQDERERTSKIDTKSNILISLCGIILVAMLQVVDLRKIFEVSCSNFIDVILPGVLLIMILAALVTGVISTILILRVICIHRYNVLDPAYFLSETALKEEESVFVIGIAIKLIEAISYNKSVNDKRAATYSKALVCLVVSLIFFAVYMCLISFL